MSDFSSSFLRKGVVPTSDAPNSVKELDFEILGSQEVRKMSAMTVTKFELYDNSNTKAQTGGPVDLRLGTTTEVPCQTCGEEEYNCPGHFGSLNLLFPVFNTGYYSHIIHTLKCICKTCSHILLPTKDINNRLRRLYNTNSPSVYSRIERMKGLIAECMKVTVCPHCGAFNGTIKKTKNLLIINHIIGQKNESIRTSFTDQFTNLKLPEKEYDQVMQNVCEDLTPIRVLHLFDNIPTREIPLLTYSKKISHPADMILSTFIVPPNNIRPAVVSPGEGSNENDLTIRLREAIDLTSQLKKNIDAGNFAKNIADRWNSIQQTMNAFINSEGSDIPKKKMKKNKPIIGLAQRLKGKQGRFRNNLSGKRVNFSGRTVISPDPNVNVDQVVVPLEMAMTLTFPVVVTKFNIEFLRKCIINGATTYPGANYLKQNNRRRMLKIFKPEDRSRLAHELKCGDIVERHLIDNDIVLFNRQPSLHRISIMAYRAKVMPWRTLRFNECSCSPFNADFDGDEMNIHLPQTLEAAADAKFLMNVLYNLFSPRSGELIVAPTQDFLSGTYLLTRKNVFLNYSQFSFLAAQIFDSNIRLDIPPPAIMYPVQLWTGKQLLSLMIKPNDDEKFNFTHNINNKEYGGNLHMDKNDGYVSFMDSELISGVLEKSLIGGGGKSIFGILARDVSPQYAAICMGRIAKLACRYIMNRGFSIGITDVTPTERLETGKKKVIEEAYQKSANKIKELQEGKLEAAPGMTAEATLESFLNDTLSKVRNDIGSICLKELSNLNTALVMAKSGAKGSDINISQMMACVGQQIISGQRVIVDFIDRTIPHFHHHSLEPPSKGFVANSFFSGLEPYEFFFHTMSGREGLVDAAVKTAETGYLQRRLMKSLEDATVHYDGTVRMADDTIVQFNYGEDGLDPLVMETRSYPIDLKRISFEMMNKNRDGELVTPRNALQLFESLINTEKEKPRMPFNIPLFLLNTFEGFFKNDVITKYEDLLLSYVDSYFLPLLDQHEKFTILELSSQRKKLSQKEEIFYKKYNEFHESVEKLKSHILDLQGNFANANDLFRPFRKLNDLLNRSVIASFKDANHDYRQIVSIINDNMEKVIEEGNIIIKDVEMNENEIDETRIITLLSHKFKLEDFQKLIDEEIEKLSKPIDTLTNGIIKHMKKVNLNLLAIHNLNRKHFSEIDQAYTNNNGKLQNIKNRLNDTRNYVSRLANNLNETKNSISEIKQKIVDHYNEIMDKLYIRTINDFFDRIDATFPVTNKYVQEFVSMTLKRLEKALIEPGATVGALAGQSIGEPATQMTLRSFHFAGVASMNVTLGVPRIQEVMNAVKNIKTPVIDAKIYNNTEESNARVMKGLIDKVLLGQITKSIKEIQMPNGCYIEIVLDTDLIDKAMLNLSVQSVINSICTAKKLGVKQENINRSGDTIQISFRDMQPSSLAFALQQLLLKLPSVPVSGLDGVNRVLISNDKDKNGNKLYKLFVESNNYLNVLNTDGIDWRHTNSNHTLDVEKVLGIEAARSVIVSEISNVYQNYSLSIDQRHLFLLADTMTMKGRINGINRHGLAKTCSSSLKLASFEVTMEQLYNAGFHQIQDSATDVTSTVILGSFARIGSGMCDILIAKDLIKEPALTPKLKFLTPQEPSEIRNQIESGTFQIPKPNPPQFTF